MLAFFGQFGPMPLFIGFEGEFWEKRPGCCCAVLVVVDEGLEDGFRLIGRMETVELGFVVEGEDYGFGGREIDLVGVAANDEVLYPRFKKTGRVELSCENKGLASAALMQRNLGEEGERADA